MDKIKCQNETHHLNLNSSLADLFTASPIEFQSVKANNFIQSNGAISWTEKVLGNIANYFIIAKDPGAVKLLDIAVFVVVVIVVVAALHGKK